VLLAALPLACRRAPAPEAGEPPASDSVAEQEARTGVEILPYATWVPTTEAERRGVTLRVAERVAPGLNLFNPRQLFEARLFDSSGKVVHDWGLRGRRRTTVGWHHVEPLSGGRLAALVKEKRIDVVDWDSRRLWKFPARVHHDVAATRDGELLVPCWGERVARDAAGEFPVLDEEILELSSDGRLIARRSVWPLLADRISSDRLAAAARWVRRRIRESTPQRPFIPTSDTPADLLHLNSIEEIPRELPGVARAGDLLISLRELDLVAIVDRGLTTVRWSWGPGVIERQHDPSLLANGHILIFDNGALRGASRVVEIDPSDGRIVWQYPEPDAGGLFSSSRGAAQRLANGDTLITESNAGRAVEVDRTGRPVWEFFSPDTRMVGDPPVAERAAIYRLRRLEPDDLRELGIEERLRAERRGRSSSPP